MTDTVSPTTRSAMMRAVRSRDTAPERVVRRLAHALGYRFRLNRRDLPGSPDLVFPGRRKVIFVHGCFWHRHDCRAGRSTPAANRDFWLRKFSDNVRRDRRVARRLRADGWGVMTVWECQTKLAGRERLAGRLKRFLEESAGR